LRVEACVIPASLPSPRDASDPAATPPRARERRLTPRRGARAQLYGCNVLNLGNSRIISVHAHTARQIVRDSHFRGDVQIIDFTPITSMYGAVHCSSQARLNPSCNP